MHSSGRAALCTQRRTRATGECTARGSPAALAALDLHRIESSDLGAGALGEIVVHDARIAVAANESVIGDHLPDRPLSEQCSAQGPDPLVVEPSRHGSRRLAVGDAFEDRHRKRPRLGLTMRRLTGRCQRSGARPRSRCPAARPAAPHASGGAQGRSWSSRSGPRCTCSRRCWRSRRASA